MIQTWPMFGSTFFYIKHVADARINGECIMAINKQGAYFLDKDNHVRAAPAAPFPPIQYSSPPPLLL